MIKYNKNYKQKLIIIYLKKIMNRINKINRIELINQMKFNFINIKILLINNNKNYRIININLINKKMNIYQIKMI